MSHRRSIDFSFFYVILLVAPREGVVVLSDLFQKRRKIGRLKKILDILDYGHKLSVSTLDLPLKSLIIVGDGHSSRPRKPTTYIINSSFEGLMTMSESLMVRHCARAVRCRRQSGENKLETFVDIYEKLDDDGLLKPTVSSMSFNTWGKYEADAQVVAVIAEYLHLWGYSLEEVQRMLLMDASKIVEIYEIR